MTDVSGRATLCRLQISFLAGTALCGLWAAAAAAQNAPPPQAGTVERPKTLDQQQESAKPPAGPGQDIVITGYRGSLQSSTNAKKRSVGFSDSIFAQDIGK